MSDEEKKATESLKNIAIYIGDNYTFSQQGIRNLRENLRIVLPVIEKQSKEIEHQKEKRANQRQELAILNAKQVEFNKLVNTVNSYKGQFKRQEKEIEELNKENTRQHELIGNIHQKWKDTIKAKIEFIKSLNEKLYYEENVISILQSLLEKENKMNDEDLEEIFGYINMIEDRIQKIGDNDLYEYIINCITTNEWCTLENYKEILEDKEK